MTTMYTLGCIVMSLAFTLSIFNIIEMVKGKSKIWILPILIVVGILLVLGATSTPRIDRYYEVKNPHSYQKLFPNAYEEGYNAAIKDAVLVEVNENSYILSFNGEDNIYYNK